MRIHLCGGWTIKLAGTLLLSSMMVSCRLPFVSPLTGDTFEAAALSNYVPYSDKGYPWSVGPNSLQGNGLALQSVLIRKSVFLPDGWVETVSDSADDGGLVLRFSDNQNYYLLAIRDDRAPSPRNIDNLEIYRRTGAGQGGFVSLWRKDVIWPRGVPHVIRFEARGDRLTVYFDAREVGTISDSRPLTGEGIGVRHYGGDASWITRYRRVSWGHGK